VKLLSNVASLPSCDSTPRAHRNVFSRSEPKAFLRSGRRHHIVLEPEVQNSDVTLSFALTKIFWLPTHGRQLPQTPPAGAEIGL
jgi:hypothetical protein